MSINVGKTDQIIRALLGIVLVLAPFVTSLAVFDNAYAVYAAIAVGAVLVLTSTFRICPLYSIFGIRTCKV